ncbi:triphosphoribosyl-dephospho-CoA synthase [Cohaesibacter sp. ES.047]|uniref:triphosphoribosyl-dephospho-CoA synthase CitG n=1 Tax=Cohaesibacter sp. ES.047 TaxID=1798205 RepID=UPI000BB90A97|nr:triphosphoribosyl-dephospho-CoA synthase CitG [Cohaesibacter sp. ES.047]SNY93198.1 triphosphoribosyl-dephospho-CoA synthase [Cohaesibacter sp. ES.047]
MTKLEIPASANINLALRAATPIATEAKGLQVGVEGNIDQALADLAHEALIAEATLTPKPGLVDRRNNGSHEDMTLTTFMASAEVLHPHFAQFVTLGRDTSHDPAPQAFAQLRSHGLTCENAMNRGTGGINTHKGAIFAFGLLLGAAGRCIGQGRSLTPELLCQSVAEMLSGLVDRELVRQRHTATTAGEHIFRRYGLSGARGEAEGGFPTVMRYALPAFSRAIQNGHDTESALLAAMLELLAHNRDTNLVTRGGIEELFLVRRLARDLRKTGGVNSDRFHEDLMAMDDDLIARNLSPGGSADLVAVTWFLSQIPRVMQASDREAAE